MTTCTDTTSRIHCQAARLPKLNFLKTRIFRSPSYFYGIILWSCWFNFTCIHRIYISEKFKCKFSAELCDKLHIKKCNIAFISILLICIILIIKAKQQRNFNWNLSKISCYWIVCFVLVRGAEWRWIRFSTGSCCLFSSSLLLGFVTKVQCGFELGANIKLQVGIRGFSYFVLV